MEDTADTAKLTTPVSKKNSLLKMLKKQLTREAKESQRESQHGSVAYSDGNVTIEPIPIYAKVQRSGQRRSSQRDHHSHGTQQQRPRPSSSGFDMEIVDDVSVRQRDRPAGKNPTSQQQEINMNPLYENMQNPMYENIQINKPQSSRMVDKSQVNATTGWRDYGSTGNSDCEDSSSSSYKTRSDTPSDEPLTIDGVTAAESTDEPDRPKRPKQRVQYADQPWTIHNDTYFVYGPSFRASRKSKTKSAREWCAEMWSYGIIQRLRSVWINVALLLLLVSNLMYMTAFCTNDWGILHLAPPPGAASTKESPTARRSVPVITANSNIVSSNNTSILDWLQEAWDEISQKLSHKNNEYDGNIEETHSSERNQRDLQEAQKTFHAQGLARAKKPADYWSFGLWQCCRHSDQLCLGIRFSAFYSATRTFSVLSLFGMVLSFAWMLGHSLERLLDYDVCTMSCLISLQYATTLFTTLAVASFGVRWPVVFANEFEGTDPKLSYSFYIAVCTIPLTLTAAILTTIDLVKVRQREKQFYTDDELSFMDQGEDSIPTDNISRPRVQKKKRRGNQSMRYSTAGTSS